jgi:hypothetical protein
MKQASGFEIWNKHGHLKFSGTIDLTDIDLVDAVVINQRDFQVYEGKQKSPPFGQGLNRPATVTFYHFEPNCK